MKKLIVILLMILMPVWLPVAYACYILSNPVIQLKGIYDDLYQSLKVALIPVLLLPLHCCIYNNPLWRKQAHFSQKQQMICCGSNAVG